MLVICLGVTLSGLDGVIVNVALPQISQQLHSSAASAVWIATAYQLAVVASLLPCASIGESIGYRRVYLAGMGIFLLGSAACALSQTLPMLLAARAAQGIGGGAMIGVSMALVRFIYPQRLLGRGLALYGLIAALSMTLGPSVAAAILSVASWPWLFAVNLPIGVLALAIGGPLLPVTAGERRRFDAPGAILSGLMFICLIGGIDGLGDRHTLGWALALLAAGVGCALILVRHQAGQSRPLLPLDLLAGRLFFLAGTTSVCTYAAQTAAFVALPFVFEHDLHRTAAATGLLLTPWPFLIVLAAPVSGRLADRLPPGAVTGIGLFGLAAGLILLTRLQPGAAAVDIVWRMALCGLGVGLFQAPNNRAMMMAAPAARSGSASGMVAVARIFGMALGAAMASVAFALFAAQGARSAVLIAAGLAAVACAFSLLRSRGPGLPQAPSV